MKALLIAIACVAAAVGGLAACGGSGDGAAQAQPPATATTIAAAQAMSTAVPTAQAPPTATVTADTTAQAPPSATPTADAVATGTATPSATSESLRAPEFSLPAARGGTVSLSGLLDGKDGAALVFYRGFF